MVCLASRRLLPFVRLVAGIAQIPMLGWPSVKLFRLQSTTRRVAMTLGLVLLLAAPTMAASAAVRVVEPGYTCGLEFPITGGRFFSQTGGDTGRGYPVSDDATARFWTAFQDFGGVQALGYPVSQRFMLHGFVVQAFQKAILQWDPSKDGVNVANTLDVMNREGHDAWLEAFRQVPTHATLSEDDGVPFSQVIDNHLALLDVNPAIREAFLATPDWLMRLGLPIAFGEFDGLVAMRTQRAVLQQWLVDVPWARAGQVVFANSGDLAKEAGLIPAEAAAPSEPELPRDIKSLVALDPDKPTQGDVLGIRIRTPVGNAGLAWRGQPAGLLCYQGEWHSLVGIGATAAPGAAELSVRLGTRSATVNVDVAAGQFPSLVIEVAENLEDLLDEAVAQEERELLLPIVQQVNGPPRWSGAFTIPSRGTVTSVYGERRTLQPGSYTTVHQGVDFAAFTGMWIPAPNRGRIVWMGPLTIRGNTVVIDHGYGVFTLFYHLSDFTTVLGQEVQGGDTVGLVGSTGRSTGPHIHWEMYVAGVAVDPTRWVEGPYYQLGDAEAYVPAQTPAVPSGDQGLESAVGSDETGASDPDGQDADPSAAAGPSG